MSIARVGNFILWLGLSPIAAAQSSITVPSDPAAWPVDEVERPEGTTRCPGGEASRLLALVPELQAQTLAQYEAITHVSIAFLQGTRPTDRVYPFNFGTRRSAGGDFGAAGFYLVRGGCIIHVHRLELID